MIQLEVQCCCNCQLHKTHNKQHQEQHYRYFYQQLGHIASAIFHQHVNMFKNKLPQHYKTDPYLLVYGAGLNKYINEQSKKIVTYPRYGAFEIKINNRVIFSKISSGRWPNLQKIKTVLTEMKDLFQGGVDLDSVLDRYQIGKEEMTKNDNSRSRILKKIHCSKARKIVENSRPKQQNLLSQKYQPIKFKKRPSPIILPRRSTANLTIQMTKENINTQPATLQQSCLKPKEPLLFNIRNLNAQYKSNKPKGQSQSNKDIGGGMEKYEVEVDKVDQNGTFTEQTFQFENSIENKEVKCQNLIKGKQCRIIGVEEQNYEFQQFIEEDVEQNVHQEPPLAPTVLPQNKEVINHKDKFHQPSQTHKLPQINQLSQSSVQPSQKFQPSQYNLQTQLQDHSSSSFKFQLTTIKLLDNRQPIIRDEQISLKTQKKGFDIQKQRCSIYKPQQRYALDQPEQRCVAHRQQERDVVDSYIQQIYLQISLKSEAQWMSNQIVDKFQQMQSGNNIKMTSELAMVDQEPIVDANLQQQEIKQDCCQQNECEEEQFQKYCSDQEIQVDQCSSRMKVNNDNHQPLQSQDSHYFYDTQNNCRLQFVLLVLKQSQGKNILNQLHAKSSHQLPSGHFISLKELSQQNEQIDQEQMITQGCDTIIVCQREESISNKEEERPFCLDENMIIQQSELLNGCGDVGFGREKQVELQLLMVREWLQELYVDQELKCKENIISKKQQEGVLNCEQQEKHQQNKQLFRSSIVEQQSEQQIQSQQPQQYTIIVNQDTTVRQITIKHLEPTFETTSPGEFNPILTQIKQDLRLLYKDISFKIGRRKLNEVS